MLNLCRLVVNLIEGKLILHFESVRQLPAFDMAVNFIYFFHYSLLSQNKHENTNQADEARKTTKQTRGVSLLSPSDSSCLAHTCREKKAAFGVMDEERSCVGVAEMEL